MKNYSIVYVLFMGLIFFSCEKENIKNDLDSTENIANIEGSISLRGDKLHFNNKEDIAFLLKDGNEDVFRSQRNAKKRI